MRKVRGFTLVEVVVALTILSLVVMATLTGMRTLAITQARLDVRADQTARLRAVSSFLYNSITGAQPVAMTLLGRSDGKFFFGGQNSLIWAAPLSIPGVEGGLFALRLSLNEAGELRVQIRENIDAVGWSDEESYLLSDEVDLLHIQYREERSSPWLNEWVRQAHEHTPSHVKISLQVSGRYWPEMIIPVRGW